MNSAAAAKSLQSCPTLCNPIDGNPPGSPVPGILQARTLEWVAISFSNAWKWKVKVKSLSRVLPSATPWAAAFQAPPSMGFSRQEYWSGVPLPSFLDLQSVCFFYFSFLSSVCSWFSLHSEICGIYLHQMLHLSTNSNICLLILTLGLYLSDFFKSYFPAFWMPENFFMVWHVF